VELFYEVENEGDVSMMHVYSTDLQDFRGFQLCIKSNSQIDITDILNGQLSIEAGQIRITPNTEVLISHNLIDAIDLNSEMPLFTLMMDKLRPENYGSFYLNNNKLNGEIYSNDKVSKLNLISANNDKIQKL